MDVVPVASRQRIFGLEGLSRSEMLFGMILVRAEVRKQGTSAVTASADI